MGTSNSYSVIFDTKSYEKVCSYNKKSYEKVYNVYKVEDDCAWISEKVTSFIIS